MTEQPPTAEIDARLVYWNDHGLGLILRGHGHDPDTMQALGQRDLGAAVIVEEHWLDWTPRIKWCGNRDWPCDNEGEWHGHWFPCKPTPGAEWTVLLPYRPTPPAVGEEEG